MKYFPIDIKELETDILSEKVSYSESTNIEYRAIYNWAINTCINEIRNSVYPAVVVCEEFINRMDKCAFSVDDPDIRYSWIIAKDAGEYLLDIFIEEIEKYQYQVNRLKKINKRRNNR